MYAYLMFHMRGEFFDAICDEWLRIGGFKLDDEFITDHDMMYCGGGPL